MADRPEMFGPTRGFSGMADSTEPYKMLWGRSFLVAVATKIWAHLFYFCTKLPISRLLCQIDRICLGLPGAPTLVAMAATFGLGVESNRIPACYYYYGEECLCASVGFIRRLEFRSQRCCFLTTRNETSTPYLSLVSLQLRLF